MTAETLVASSVVEPVVDEGDEAGCPGDAAALSKSQKKRLAKKAAAVKATADGEAVPAAPASPECTDAAAEDADDAEDDEDDDEASGQADGGSSDPAKKKKKKKSKKKKVWYANQEVGRTSRASYVTWRLSQSSFQTPHLNT